MTMQGSMPQTLALVGAGKMGGAMLAGWLAMGLNPAGVSIIDPHASQEIRDLCQAKGVALNPEASAPPDVLVLAIKPQMFDVAAAQVGELVGSQTLILSILAGKTIANIMDRLQNARAVVRAMPNLPASIGKGASGAFANSDVSPTQRATADALLRATGVVEWLPSEDLIDAVTGLSGSGPAYVFHMVECMARAGVEAGLPADLAERLARATVVGAGELLAQSDLSPAVLRQNVTSPGGTTAAALDVLMDEDGLQPLVTATVAAAARRAGELSG
jgi:pyrroline-5-carboxylate reductase